MIRIQDGPASPVSPQTDQYYSALAHHNCSLLKSLLPSETPTPDTDQEVLLFGALDDLCFAVRDHTQKLDWAKLKVADQAAADLTDCLQQAARRALHSARVLHASRPTAPPTFARPPSGTACSPTVRAAALVDDGTTAPYLLVVGDHLFEVQKIRVAGVTRTARLLSGDIDAPNWLAGQDCGAAIVVNPPDVSHLTSTRIRVQGKGYTLTYTWHVTPALTVVPDKNATHGACTIAEVATSASATP